jgi:hypothetical protein
MGASSISELKENAASTANDWMIYAKSVLAGFLAVLLAAAGVVGMFALIVTMMGGDWRSGMKLSWKVGITAALIFGLGFAWQFRRASKPAGVPAPDKKTTSSASARRG